MNIYIAGKISGDLDYKAKFDALEAGLKKRWGSSAILNPASLPFGMTTKDYMAICISMLIRADMIILLPDWETSPGATIEKMLAEYAGISIVPLTEEEYESIAAVREVVRVKPDGKGGFVRL